MEKRKALISVPLAPYHVKPQNFCELDDEGFYGHTVEIIEEAGESEGQKQYRILTPYRYETYVSENCLYEDEGEVARYGEGEKHARLNIVTRSFADILAEPKYRAPHILTLPMGAIVEALPFEAPADDATGGAEDGLGEAWTLIRLIGGRHGYVRSSHLDKYPVAAPKNEAELRQAIVASAKRFLGTQYRWGGKSFSGIDCSGICATAYMVNGIYIYRNADIKEGFPVHAIERRDLKPADMLFFKGHVAMYIGNDKYIHSTGRKGDDGVVINSLDPEHYDYREDLDKGILALGSIF